MCQGSGRVEGYTVQGLRQSGGCKGLKVQGRVVGEPTHRVRLTRLLQLSVVTAHSAQKALYLGAQRGQVMLGCVGGVGWPYSLASVC